MSKYATVVTSVNGKVIQFKNHKAQVDPVTALILMSRPGYYLDHSDKWKDAKTVLIARNMGIGDVLFVSTVPAYIKKINPKCHLTFLTFSKHARLLKDHPYIDTVDDIAKLNDPQYVTNFEYAMNFNNFFESGSRVPQGNTKHRVDMLREFYSADKKDWDTTIYNTITQEEKEFAARNLKVLSNKKTIGIVTQSSELTRRYPDNPKLVQLLADNGFGVVILSPGDAVKYNHNNILNMSGNTNLGQLWAFLQAVDLVITPDTGPLHMAGALNKKIITFFNSFPPMVRTAYYKNCFAFSAADRCPKKLYPCGYGRCTAPCLRSITPYQFLNKVKEMI
jgi:ADP-heptose:LPS heptosyltransferase